MGKIELVLFVIVKGERDEPRKADLKNVGLCSEEKGQE